MCSNMMLKSILVGLLLTMVTVGIHAIGTSWWIERLRRRSKKGKVSNSRFRELKILFSTSTLLLFLHILEVAVWAVTYLAIPKLKSKDLETMEPVNLLKVATRSSGMMTILVNSLPFSIIKPKQMPIYLRLDSHKGQLTLQVLLLSMWP